MKRQSRFLLTFGAVLGAMIGGLAVPVAAVATPSQAPFTGHQADSAVGDVFSCLSGDLTVQTGTITTVFHEIVDNSGMFHFTGTIVPERRHADGRSRKLVHTLRRIVVPRQEPRRE